MWTYHTHATTLLSVESGQISPEGPCRLLRRGDALRQTRSCLLPVSPSQHLTYGHTRTRTSGQPVWSTYSTCKLDSSCGRAAGFRKHFIALQTVRLASRPWKRCLAGRGSFSKGLHAGALPETSFCVRAQHAQLPWALRRQALVVADAAANGLSSTGIRTCACCFMST
jgi:hypothetical protein